MDGTAKFSRMLGKVFEMCLNNNIGSEKERTIMVGLVAARFVSQDALPFLGAASRIWRIHNGGI